MAGLRHRSGVARIGTATTRQARALLQSCNSVYMQLQYACRDKQVAL
jgi:hypothetical protein